MQYPEISFPNILAAMNFKSRCKITVKRQSHPYTKAKNNMATTVTYTLLFYLSLLTITVIANLFLHDQLKGNLKKS